VVVKELSIILVWPVNEVTTPRLILATLVYDVVILALVIVAPAIVAEVIIPLLILATSV